ncbi:MAG: GNAT family N-acetyltransferase [Chloroflexi bacterium]|nr:GNAT family N-acetyltransferase [Chloroflexota bacterium]
MRVLGGKVVLREKRPQDASQDYLWRGDEELSRLDACVPLRLPFADYYAFYYQELHFPDSSRCRFAIETLEGEHIGNCTYYDIDRRRRQCQVGIMIGDRAYWNRGYGTDALTTLVEHIFRTTDFQRVYLETLEWNIRAQRSFHKVGFVPCGYGHRPPYTFVVMETSREEWQARSRFASLKTAASTPEALPSTPTHGPR